MTSFMAPLALAMSLLTLGLAPILRVRADLCGDSSGDVFHCEDASANYTSDIIVTWAAVIFVLICIVMVSIKCYLVARRNRLYQARMAQCGQADQPILAPMNSAHSYDAYHPPPFDKQDSYPTRPSYDDCDSKHTLEYPPPIYNGV